MKAHFRSFKKYFFISCVTVLIFGVQGPVDRKIASLSKDCKDQPANNSLMSVISKLIDSQSVINNRIEDGTEVFNPHIYSKSGFFLHGQFNYSTYTSAPFDSEFTEEQLAAYDAKVDELAQYREEQMQSAWAPHFGTEGEILNPFYGFGEETSQGIKQMYEFPTMANPIIGYTPPEQEMAPEESQVPEQASATVYYPQNSAI